VKTFTHRELIRVKFARLQQMTFTHCHALWVRLDDGSEANLIGIHSDGVRACVAVADDGENDDDAGYIETLIVVPLCSVTILEEDRDMRCRSPAHLGVVVDGHVRVVWLPKIVSEIGLKSIQELGYTVESDRPLQCDVEVKRRLVSFASWEPAAVVARIPYLSPVWPKVKDGGSSSADALEAAPQVEPRGSKRPAPVPLAKQPSPVQARMSAQAAAAAAAAHLLAHSPTLAAGLDTSRPIYRNLPSVEAVASMNLTRSAPRFAATGPLGPRGSRHDPARWKPWPTNASGAFGCPVCGLFVFSRANNVTEHCKQCTGDRNCEVEKWALRQGLGGAAKNTSAASEVEPKYGVSAQGHAPQTAPVTTAGRMKITQLESHMGDLLLLRDLPPLELLARLVVVDGERLSMQGRADLSAASRKAVEHAIAKIESTLLLLRAEIESNSNGKLRASGGAYAAVYGPLTLMAESEVAADVAAIALLARHLHLGSTQGACAGQDAERRGILAMAKRAAKAVEEESHFGDCSTSDALALFGLLLDNERELHQRVALAVRMHAAKVERLLPEYALALALRAPTEHPLLAYLHAYLTLTPAQARAVRKKTVRLHLRRLKHQEQRRRRNQLGEEEDADDAAEVEAMEVAYMEEEAEGYGAYVRLPLSMAELEEALAAVAAVAALLPPGSALGAELGRLTCWLQRIRAESRLSEAAQEGLSTLLLKLQSPDGSELSQEAQSARSGTVRALLRRLKHEEQRRRGDQPELEEEEAEEAEAETEEDSAAAVVEAVDGRTPLSQAELEAALAVAASVAALMPAGSTLGAELGRITRWLQRIRAESRLSEAAQEGLCTLLLKLQSPDGSELSQEAQSARSGTVRALLRRLKHEEQRRRGDQPELEEEEAEEAEAETEEDSAAAVVEAVDGRTPLSQAELEAALAVAASVAALMPAGSTLGAELGRLAGWLRMEMALFERLAKLASWPASISAKDAASVRLASLASLPAAVSAEEAGASAAEQRAVFAGSMRPRAWALDTTELETEVRATAAAVARNDGRLRVETELLVHGMLP